MLREALERLGRRGWTRLASGPHSRSPKYRHLLEEALGLDVPEQSVLAVLMLRGPQTSAELRARAERLHAFASVAAVDEVLARLADRGLARLNERRPGEREARWQQLVSPDPGGAAAAPVARAGVRGRAAGLLPRRPAPARSPTAWPSSRPRWPTSPRGSSSSNRTTDAPPRRWPWWCSRCCRRRRRPPPAGAPGSTAAEKIANARQGRVAFALIDADGTLHQRGGRAAFRTASLLKPLLLATYLRRSDVRGRQPDEGRAGAARPDDPALRQQRRVDHPRPGQRHGDRSDGARLRPAAVPADHADLGPVTHQRRRSGAVLPQPGRRAAGAAPGRTRTGCCGRSSPRSGGASARPGRRGGASSSRAAGAPAPAR